MSDYIPDPFLDFPFCESLYASTIDCQTECFEWSTLTPLHPSDKIEPLDLPLELPPKTNTKCACRKSSCVKLRCSCFSAEGMCGPDCECLNCLNRPEHESARDLAVAMHHRIFNNAFKTQKTIIYKGRRILARGCRCSSSGCDNRYCACFKNGAECSSLCRCVDCLYEKVEVSDDTKQSFLEKNRRKRLKLIVQPESELIHTGLGSVARLSLTRL